MRYNFFVSYALDRDVHTALHLAGAQSTDLIMRAVREYVVKHGHPAGLLDVQMQAAIDGLGIQAPVVSAQSAPAPVPVFVPVSVPVPAQASTPINQESAGMAFAFSQLDDA